MNAFPKELLLVGVLALGSSNQVQAQSATWAGGTGNWFDTPSKWVCPNATSTVPCAPPNGVSAGTATIGTVLNGVSTSGVVNADAPFNVNLLNIGTGANGSLSVGPAAAGSGTYRTTVGPQGTLSIHNGGTLNSYYVTSAGGSIVVDGPSSTINAVALYSGGPTGGSLALQNGAVEQTTYGGVGGNRGDIGTATINGSSWNTTNEFDLGSHGSTGTLSITNGGLSVSHASLHIGGYGVGSVGNLNINHGGVYATSLIAGTDVAIGIPGGTANITLTNHSGIDATECVIGDQAVLTVDSTSRLTIYPIFTLDPGGVINLDIDSLSTTAPLWLPNSLLTLDGTLNIDFINGFAPTAGEIIPLVFLDARNFNLSHSTINVQGLDPGFQYAFLTDTTGINLEALNNGVAASATPEPLSILLMGLAFLLMATYNLSIALRTRRKRC